MFLFWGLCIDVLGYIFVVDENNCVIYVLDKDGCFLIMLIILGELGVILIFVCLDCKNNFGIGCLDGKIRILKYLD